MKISFILLLPFLIILSCKTSTEAVTTDKKPNMLENKQTNSDCPENGSCTIMAYKNSSIEVVKESNGTFYAERVPGENIVVEYTFSRKGPEGTADGNYFETLLFEVPQNTQTLSVKDNQLQDLHMIFSTHGNRMANFYKVDSGNLQLKRKADNLDLDLNFHVNGSSQEVSKINQSVRIQ